jgi:prepilin peptidase CpaA
MTTLAPWAGWLVVALTIGLLVWAAWCDVAIRTIPDSASIILVLLGIAVRADAGLVALATSTVVAASLFMLLVFLHSRAILGGGDVKLAAAIALGLSPLGTYRFLVVTSLAGGVLVLIHLCLRRIPSPPAPSRPARSLLGRIARAELWRVRRRGSLPYGVAIAFGGAWVALTGPGG